MNELLPSVRHNVTRLFRFGGRDTNREFWPWAILVFLVQMMAGFLIMLPMMANVMTRSLEISSSARREGKPDPEVVAAQMESVVQATLAGIDRLWLPSLLIQCAAILLLAAAVARRLHDRDRSGLWGLIPIPFIVIGIVNMPLGADVLAGRPLTGLQSILLALGYGYWIALLTLIVMLVGNGDEGPNRFGPRPQAKT